MLNEQNYKFHFESGIPAGTPGILFRIGSFSVYTYSITLLFGFLAAILTVVLFWQREKYKWEYLYSLILLTVPCSLIGARLWDLVEEAIYNPNYNWKRWYAIWEGGLSIQGGVILSVIVDLIYIYNKRHEVDIRKVVDIIIPTILIGQVIGRWGNYANHEIFGKVDWTGRSVEIFGESFAQNFFINDAISDKYGVAGLYRYPLFLYEGIANFTGYLIIVWVINLMRLLKPGASASLYFIWYGLVRLSLEPLRESSFIIYQIAAGLFIALGALWLISFQFFPKVHYARRWEKYTFVYTMLHWDQYLEHVKATTFIGKRKVERLAYV